MLEVLELRGDRPETIHRDHLLHGQSIQGLLGGKGGRVRLCIKT
jgi:hypothetical protein